MLAVLQIIAIVLVAVAMAMALAHALELPGKMRLSREAYLGIQAIYYPGFTIGGGVGEAGGLIATFLLLFLTPAGGRAFWLVLGAFLSLLAMHAAYWVLTHPVNKFWLAGFKPTGLGGRFFALGKGSQDAEVADWTVFRDRWSIRMSRAPGLVF